jgi:FdrA protein
MMLEGLKALQSDPTPEVIVLVSKPPSKEVAGDVLAQVRVQSKPTVVCFLGGKKRHCGGERRRGCLNARGSSGPRGIAGGGRDPATGLRAIKRRNKALRVQALAARDALHKRQRYFRGLFSGGTFCYETQIILSKMLGRGQILSNVPIWKRSGWQTPTQARDTPRSTWATTSSRWAGSTLCWIPRCATAGSSRKQVTRRPPSSLLDIVLGYGVHPDPAGAAIEAIQARRFSPSEIAASSSSRTSAAPTATHRTRAPRRRHCATPASS